MAEQTATRRFVPHPDAERFDKVVVEVVERWKESELSGDEWRFAHVATFYRHGQPVARRSHLSIEKVLLAAAAEFGDIKVPVKGEDDKYEPWMGDLSEVCCQPGCTKPWVVLLHPVKRYDSRGQQMARPYDADDVRGFCERHRHRGDCGLDDSDFNYELVEERFPPEWANEESSALAEALQYVWNDHVGDTGAVPEAFRMEEDEAGRTLMFADFAKGNFLARVEEHLRRHGYDLVRSGREW